MNCYRKLDYQTSFFFQCMAMLFASANAFVGHGSDDGKLNPHKNICWDVSVYKEVDYAPKPCEKCHPTLEKTPVPKEQEVSIVKYKDST